MAIFWILGILAILMGVVLIRIGKRAKNVWDEGMTLGLEESIVAYVIDSGCVPNNLQYLVWSLNYAIHYSYF